MKKNIATFLRRVAQKLDPQKPEETGYARKAVDFIPYSGIDIYRRLMINGSEDEARNLKARIRVLTEALAAKKIEDNLCNERIIRMEHNFGTQARVVNGITCEPNGMTVIIELKGTWL